MGRARILWNGLRVDIFTAHFVAYVARLPDRDSQIFRLYVFGPLGLKDYGSAAKFEIKFYHQATLVYMTYEKWGCETEKTCNLTLAMICQSIGHGRNEDII